MVLPTMKACPSSCIDWRSAARTIGATSGADRLAALNSPDSCAVTSGSKRPAAPSSTNPVRSSSAVLPGTPAARTVARRSAISWSARLGSGVRSSASASPMRALPWALSSGNCSSICSTSGRARSSARALCTQRAARACAPRSSPSRGLSCARISSAASVSVLSVAARNRSRSASSWPPAAAVVEGMLMGCSAGW